MNNTNENGQSIEMEGKSGHHYTGQIYTDKDSVSSITGSAIVLLSNSTQTDTGWDHRVNSIYNTENVVKELEQFKNRDDISHLILLPYSENSGGVTDKVDDLIRNYVHR